MELRDAQGLFEVERGTWKIQPKKRPHRRTTQPIEGICWTSQAPDKPARGLSGDALAREEAVKVERQEQINRAVQEWEATNEQQNTTYLCPPSRGLPDCRRPSDALVLALGLSEGLALEFWMEALPVLPDALLAADMELAVEAIWLGLSEGTLTPVVESHTAQSDRARWRDESRTSAQSHGARSALSKNAGDMSWREGGRRKWAVGGGLRK